MNETSKIYQCISSSNQAWDSLTYCAEADLFRHNDSFVWNGLCCLDVPTNTSICCMASFDPNDDQNDQQDLNKSNQLKLVVDNIFTNLSSIFKNIFIH